MKKITRTILACVCLLAWQNLNAQYTTQAEVISAGGGKATGGIYSNFSVLGEANVIDESSFGSYLTRAGFIYRIGGLILSVNPDTLFVTEQSGTTTFYITNLDAGNMDWEISVSSGASWLSITSPATGTNDATVTVAFETNTALMPDREGSITVTAADAENSPATIVVQQLAGTDYQALEALYQNTNNGNWTDSTNWLLPGQPIDNSWHGVTINNGRVSSVKLKNNNLVGTLPAELGNLTEMANLTLSENQLSGSLPNTIGSLTKLQYLYLSDNNLSNSIPPEIGSMASLKYIYLDKNQLSGLIPVEIGSLSNLFYLQLTDNELSGSIPSELGNLTTLCYLQIAGNNLTGSIPPNLANLTGLVRFYLNGNQLSGSIPTNLFDNMNSLQRVNFSYNQLSGAIPSGLGNLSNLTQLHFHENFFDVLPDFSASGLDKSISLFVYYNNLTFNDVIPDMVFTNMTYWPQRQTDAPVNAAVTVGSSYQISTSVVEAGNQYQWYKYIGGSSSKTLIPEATTSSYTIASFTADDAGRYTCEITNPGAPLLTLLRHSITLSVAEGLKSATMGDIIAVTTQSEEEGGESPVLKQNYPNPFSNETTIEYYVPEAQHVLIEVFDLLGNKIAVIEDRVKTEGYHTIELSKKHLIRGVYLYRMITKEGAITKRMEIM